MARRSIQKHFTERKCFIYCLAITFGLLIIPQIIRIMRFDSLLIGQQAYYHILVAPYSLNPYHFLLYALSLIFNIVKVSMFLPMALGLASTVLFYLILKGFKLDKSLRFFIHLAFLLSPVFIFTFTVSNPHSLAIFLLILGFYFFIKQRTLFFIISLFFFFLASLYSIFNAILILLLLFGYVSIMRRKYHYILIAIPVLALAMFISDASFFFQFEPVVDTGLTGFISGLGAKQGFGVFNILLLLVGLIVTWKNKIRYATYYALLAFLLFSSFVLGSDANQYMNFIFAIFAGFGLHRIVGLKWKLEVVRNFTFLIISCGLIFSTVSCISGISSENPTIEMRDSLLWLGANSKPGDVVLSHPLNGFWIEYFSRLATVADPYKGNEQLNDIFYNSSLDRTKELLNENNVTYIWINKEMKQGLVWQKENQGLLFLFRNNETFKNVFSTADIEIWSVIR